MFNLREDKQGAAIVYFAEGSRMTGKESERFRHWCDDKEISKFSCVVVDCENLEFIDSMGIASLIRLYRVIMESGGKLLITRLSQEIKEVLATLRLDSLLAIKSDDPSSLIMDNC